MTTNDARKGYSSALIKLVESQDQTNVVTRFARRCIEQNVPVNTVAQRMGVSRAMVYYWFKGQNTPRRHHLEQMQRVLDKLTPLEQEAQA